jgi:hypothetical protein
MIPMRHQARCRVRIRNQHTVHYSLNLLVRVYTIANSIVYTLQLIFTPPQAIAAMLGSVRTARPA